MAEGGVYLEKLSAFSRMLHLAGLPVSPQETGDAARLLTDLGLADREQVKTALRTVYAKSQEEQKSFDRVFDGFFISAEAMKAQAKAQMEREAQLAAAQAQISEDLRLGEGTLELTEDQRQAYAAMPESAKERLRAFMEKYRANAERNPGLYGEFIHSVFAKAILEQQLMMEDAAVSALALDPELGLLYRDISQFQDTEIPRAIALIQSAARQINGELSAKGKNRGRSAALDFRPTLRKGLETGGSLYRLRYKKSRNRRKHLVVLCDVSGSMLQFSEFALRFIQSLNQVAESSKIYLFSETMVEADPFQLQNMDRFRGFVRESGIYGRGTDLGTALGRLSDAQPPVLNSATTLLILSDTKTIDQARALAALAEAKRRAGRVLWLNPIPQGKWQYLRSVEQTRQLVTMVPCGTLRELAAACRRLTG